MLDALGPADIADVNQAFHALFDFDERAKVGEVANASSDDRADGIFFRGGVPWIGESLLEAQGNAALIRFYFEDDHINVVAGLHDFRRMLGALRPAHFTDVDEAFDAGFDLNEGAVIGDADDFTLYAGADRKTLRHGSPRIGQ